MAALLLTGGESLSERVNATALEEVEWHYDGDRGPAHWGDLDPSFRACKDGVEQSPVNLNQAIPWFLPSIVFRYQALVARRVFNNGHTIQVEVEPGATIELRGTTYTLAQFHWHAPSEHTLGPGLHYDMELHLVHRNAAGGQAVIGVLIREGKVNEHLEPIWAVLPEEKGEEHALGLHLTDADLLPASRAYYFYNGSLTTPPCMEGVLWHVMATPVEMSRDQIVEFSEALNHSCCARNDRPTQPLHDRLVIRGIF
jgi:carbonic anhydrase